jgi:hypothetical protein
VRATSRGSRADLPPPPGQAPIVAAGLTIGILLLGIQLWLLTVALDLYLAGRGNQVWSLAAVSGVIFVGGLVVLWILGRRPRVVRTSVPELREVREVREIRP